MKDQSLPYINIQGGKKETPKINERDRKASRDPSDLLASYSPIAVQSRRARFVGMARRPLLLLDLRIHGVFSTLSFPFILIVKE